MPQLCTVSGPNLLFMRKLYLDMVVDALGLAFSSAEMRAVWRQDMKLYVESVVTVAWLTRALL